MSSLSLRRGGRLAAGIAALIASVLCCAANAQEARRPAEGFIGGVVTSARGPEAGVWVIAETTELKTPFIKIVVTDDAGRYVLAAAARRRRTTFGSAAMVSPIPTSRRAPR